MSQRRLIPKRLRFYVGCEGKSETAYVSLIRDLGEEQGLRVTIDIDDLSAGDPLSRVQEAVRRSAHKETGKEHFSGRFLLLDHDQAELNPPKATQAAELAKRNGLLMIWQYPCHEGLLLRHFEGHQNDCPANCNLAEKALRKNWPEYQKPMEKRDLAKRLDFVSVQRAAKVQPDLTSFLEAIGLVLTDG